MSDRKDEDPDQTAREVSDALSKHRGLATWGENLVPLDAFRRATAAKGRAKSYESRAELRRRFLQRSDDSTEVEGVYSTVAVFGGVYANYLAVEALLDQILLRGVDATYCLGDLGGFGPHPERIWPLLSVNGVRAIQGNYEQALIGESDDCNCGYTDPRDNHFAEIAYSYTAANCSAGFKSWMSGLPARRRVRVGSRELLLVHGSPRRVNEFLFASTTPVSYLETLLDQENCDGLLCTHTGLHWHRRLPSGRDVVNVGALGRPANDGNTNVWYAILEARGDGLSVELVPLEYDHVALGDRMRREGLPKEFIETILSGWWTTCLEILPARERSRSRY